MPTPWFQPAAVGTRGNRHRPASPHFKRILNPNISSTILVDLELNQPIALLADRKAETLADWLRQHPGVQILSRDRSKTYKSAMDKGAPAAIQVADRFQLVQNLAETLEKVLSSYGTELKAIEQQQRQTSVPTGTVVVTPKPTTTAELQAQKLVNYQHRVQQQQEIRNLSQQQWSQLAIAQAVGVSVRTVQRLLSAPDLPETASPNGSLGRSLLEPYKQSLLEWWNAQIRQPQVLMILLQQQGYTGSERTLTRYLSAVRVRSRFTTNTGEAHSRFSSSERSSIPSFN